MRAATGVSHTSFELKLRRMFFSHDLFLAKIKVQIMFLFIVDTFFGSCGRLSKFLAWPFGCGADDRARFWDVYGGATSPLLPHSTSNSVLFLIHHTRFRCIFTLHRSSIVILSNERIPSLLFSRFEYFRRNKALALFERFNERISRGVF